MPRDYRMIGSLSAAALIAALGSTGIAQESDQDNFESICTWIEEQTDPAEIARMIDGLASGGAAGVFSAEDGLNYQMVCTTLAGQRLAQQTAANQGEPLQQAN